MSLIFQLFAFLSSYLINHVMTPTSTGSLLSSVSPLCELLDNLTPIYSDVFYFMACYLVWPVLLQVTAVESCDSPPLMDTHTLHTLSNNFYQIFCQRKLILSVRPS